MNGLGFPSSPGTEHDLLDLGRSDGMPGDVSFVVLVPEQLNYLHKVSHMYDTEPAAALSCLSTSLISPSASSSQHPVRV